MSLSEIEDLQSLLRTHNGDLEKLKKVMSKIMANVYVGKDMSSLFPDVVLQIQVKESSIKRLIAMFTTQYGHLHPETALLCVNHLTKEIMHDSNEFQRGHSLQTLGSLNLPNLAEYIAPTIKHALQDSSPYVRRHAIGGCVKLYNVNREVYEEHLLSNHLEELVHDFDVSVAVVAITVLTQTRDNFKISKSTAMKMLKRLQGITEWQIPQLLVAIDGTSLCAKESEVVEVLHLIDSYLDDCSSAVVMHIVYLLNDIVSSQGSQQLKQQFMERIVSPMLFRIKHANSETAHWFCLELPRFISDLKLISKEFKAFFPAYYDPPYLKAEKLRILSLLIGENNVYAIVKSLLDCLKSPKHLDIAEELSECLTQCVLKYGDKLNDVILQLSAVMQFGSGAIISTMLPCLEKIVNSVTDVAPVILPLLQRCTEYELSGDASIALLSMLGSYGDILPECTSMLFCWVEDYSNLSNEVRLALLQTCVKQSSLSGMKGVLAKLLELIQAENDPLLRSRAMFYSSVLVSNDTSIMNFKGSLKIVVPIKSGDMFTNYPVPEVRQPEPISQPTPYKPKTKAEDTKEEHDLLSLEDSTSKKPAHNNDVVNDLIGLNLSSETNSTGNSVTEDLASLFGPSVSEKERLKDIETVKNFVKTLDVRQIQPDIYEKQWAVCSNPEKYKTSLNSTNIQVNTDLASVFLQSSISTMAVSPDNIDPLQMFLYSCTAGNLILLKLQTSFVQNTFELEVRCGNFMISKIMVKLVRYLLGVL